MYLGVGIFRSSTLFNLAVLLAFSLCSPFQAQAQTASREPRRSIGECLSDTLHSSLRILGLQHSPKPYFKDGIPLVGKDGLTLHWKDGSTEPFIHQYSESDSEAWSQAFTAKIYDRKKQPLHEITVIVPMYLQEDGKTFNEAYTTQVRDSVVRSVYELPLLHIEALKKIEVHPASNKWEEYWQKKYKSKAPVAFGALQGSISVFPSGLRRLLEGDDQGKVRHEFGHLLAEKFFHSTMPSDEYIKLARRDAHVPSNYAKNSPKEDFAEAVRLYLQTDTGRTNPELRKQLKNRFAYLDKRFKDDPNAKNYAFYSLAAAAVSVGMFSQDAQAHQTQDGNVWINDGHAHLILLQPAVPKALSAKPSPPTPTTYRSNHKAESF